VLQKKKNAEKRKIVREERENEQRVKAEYKSQAREKKWNQNRPRKGKKRVP
jgi:hypothetical protein